MLTNGTLLVPETKTQAAAILTISSTFVVLLILYPMVFLEISFWIAIFTPLVGVTLWFIKNFKESFKFLTTPVTT